MERRQGHSERRVDGTSTKDRKSERSRRDHPTSQPSATEGKTSKQSSASDDAFKTKLLRDHLPTIRDQGPSRPTKPASSLREKSRNVPPNSQKPSSSSTKIPTGTTFRTEPDVKMASRQTRIESMAPQEREEQEQWAQTQLRQLNTCPAGFQWRRIPGGYQCLPYGTPGVHKVTHDLIAEGKGGYYTQKFDKTKLPGGGNDWRGPFYTGLSAGGPAMRGPSGEIILECRALL
jgi:hypothetical protein